MWISSWNSNSKFVIFFEEFSRFPIENIYLFIGRNAKSFVEGILGIFMTFFRRLFLKMMKTVFVSNNFWRNFLALGAVLITLLMEIVLISVRRFLRFFWVLKNLCRSYNQVYLSSFLDWGIPLFSKLKQSILENFFWWNLGDRTLGPEEHS